jgi:hypothetical protein
MGDGWTGVRIEDDEGLFPDRRERPLRSVEKARKVEAVAGPPGEPVPCSDGGGQITGTDHRAPAGIEG